MSLSVTEINPGFGARIEGVDLRRPLEHGDFRRIVEAFSRFSVLVFPGQRLDDLQQVAFSERFGPLETSIRSDRTTRVAKPQVSDISNVDGKDEMISPNSERAFYNRGNQLWHTDSSFKPIPALASLLSGREVTPEGGETEFADMRAAWDAVPEAIKRRIDGAIAEHSLIYSRSTMGYTQFTDDDRERLPPVLQQVVRTHPGSGRKSLYLGSHASHFVGWNVEESRQLIKELMEAATRPEFVYSHRWTQHDLVMWDNRCVLHRGRPFDELKYRRVMHRTTVMGDGPTVPLEQMCGAAQRQAEQMRLAAAA